MPLFLAPEPLSDGGYAVSSYREVNPKLGAMEQLRELAVELRANGISLVVDFIFNHTSNEHEWARKAGAGDPRYCDYYWIFPDRTMPDGQPLSDGPNMLKIDDLPRLLDQLRGIEQALGVR